MGAAWKERIQVKACKPTVPGIECFNYGEDSDKKRNSQGGQFLPATKMEIRFPAVLSPTQILFLEVLLNSVF